MSVSFALIERMKTKSLVAHRKAAARELMLKQHGLASRPQLIRLGLHSNAIDRAVAAGRWRRVFTGVYASNDVPATPEQFVLSGVLVVGGDVSRRTARPAGSIDSLDSVNRSGR